MTKSFAAAAVVTLVLVAGLAGAQEPRKEVVHFKPGASSAAIKGTIVGRGDVDYILGAKAGQTLKVTLQATNRFAYFNVILPGDDAALFVGADSATPNTYETTLPKDGDYTVRLYLMRNAARRGEKANYTITFSIGGPAGVKAAPKEEAKAPGGFDRTLELLGMSFLEPDGLEFLVIDGAGAK